MKINGAWHIIFLHNKYLRQLCASASLYYSLVSTRDVQNPTQQRDRLLPLRLGLPLYHAPRLAQGFEGGQDRVQAESEEEAVLENGTKVAETYYCWANELLIHT
jgi:hypothetical protein